MRSKLRSAALFGGADPGGVGSLMSVAPGRPKPVTGPLGGSERSERGGMFHRIAPLLEDQLPRFAVDTAKRIDDAPLLAVERALDRLVEPAVGTAPVHEPRRECVGHVREREDRVFVLDRRTRELERRFLAVARELREHDAVGARL